MFQSLGWLCRTVCSFRAGLPSRVATDLERQTLPPCLLSNATADFGGSVRAVATESALPQEVFFLGFAVVAPDPKSQVLSLKSTQWKDLRHKTQDLGRESAGAGRKAGDAREDFCGRDMPGDARFTSEAFMRKQKRGRKYTSRRACRRVLAKAGSGVTGLKPNACHAQSAFATAAYFRRMARRSIENIPDLPHYQIRKERKDDA